MSGPKTENSISTLEHGMESCETFQVGSHYWVISTYNLTRKVWLTGGLQLFFSKIILLLKYKLTFMPEFKDEILFIFWGIKKF